ncbi:MAG: FHA domain-containing protein [Planctomycetes bacterium]|nr:FHA domain-containing protein [Planctomycetota bacterium]
MLTLILKEGAAPVTLQLGDDVIAIGRSKDNQIVLKNIKASRRHARIERIGATYQITDLGSGNGTKVNGKKIDFQALNKGDEIAIGDARITLKAIDDGPDALEAGGDDDEIKISDDTDDKLDLVDEPETEKIEWSEAETEVQAPAVKAKPAPKPLAKPAPAPARPAPAPAKPGLSKPGAGPAKPGLRKPLGRPGQK